MPQSEWEKFTANAQAGLADLGLNVDPKVAKLVAEIRNLGAGPQLEARAKLDLIILTAVNDGIKGLVKATEALVESSNENTETMSALGEQLNWLTKIYVGLTGALVLFAAVQIWVALRSSPQPIVIPAPVVNVAPPAVQFITPPPTSPAPLMKGGRKKQ